MSDIEPFDGGSVVAGMFIGVILGFFLTFLFTMSFGVEKWHERTCVEQLNQATTASDTLSVVREDPWCNHRLLRND